MNPPNLSLHFNGHFPGEPRLASVYWIEAKDDGRGGDNWTTGAISRANLQSNHHHQQTNFQFLQVGCPSCHIINSVKALRENITFHGLAYPSSPAGLPTLSLTTSSSWLPWGRVAMPLIIPLIPVPQHWCKYRILIQLSRRHKQHRRRFWVELQGQSSNWL